MQQAPKHQLADPALAASLLGATASSMTTPRHSHLAGPLFEALATLTVRVAAEAARARLAQQVEERRQRARVEREARTGEMSPVTAPVVQDGASRL